jgi:hypothetical protein
MSSPSQFYGLAAVPYFMSVLVVLLLQPLAIGSAVAVASGAADGDKPR